MDAEDLSDYFVYLFTEEYVLKFNIQAFYTAKKNEALIVNNFIYYLKTINEKQQRWVCRTTGCSASLTSVDENITKINGRKVVLDKPLTTYHQHPEVSIAEVNHIKAFSIYSSWRKKRDNVPKNA